MPPRLALLALLAVPVLACQRGTRPESPLTLEAATPPQRVWTSAFQREAVLVADEIVIEGPSDLVDHVALRQDDETTLYSAKTIPAGFWQELVARPEMGVEVRGQLDAWSLAASRKITVLQRPGEVLVTVRALGNAYWAAADGSGERRENQLVFQGVHADLDRRAGQGARER